MCTSVVKCFRNLHKTLGLICSIQRERKTKCISMGKSEQRGDSLLTVTLCEVSIQEPKYFTTKGVRQGHRHTVRMVE